MKRPRLLDLFCGAGGAAMGYHRAGFDVIGVDIKPQPHYPFEFHRADAPAFLDDLHNGWRTSIGNGYLMADFDAIHASPPCQAYANVTEWRGNRTDHEDLLPGLLAQLSVVDVPWVVENVPEAPIRPDFLLCGSQFGLKVRRHRAFETSPRAFSLIPPCHHRDLLPFMHKGERAYADALGCDWMTNREAREAIPPVYTSFIGEWLMAAITSGVAA